MSGSPGAIDRFLEEKQANWDSAKHPRVVKGHEGGGRFSKSIKGLLRDAISNGGFTYQPVTHSSPTTGYAVSPFGERSRGFTPADFTEEAYNRYWEDNADLLSDPAHHIGAWLDDRGNVVLDISIVVGSKEEAEALSHQHKQQAYYGLKEGKEFNVLPPGTAAALYEGKADARPDPWQRVQGPAGRVLRADQGGVGSGGEAMSDIEIKSIRHFIESMVHRDRGGRFAPKGSGGGPVRAKGGKLGEFDRQMAEADAAQRAAVAAQRERGFNASGNPVHEIGSRPDAPAKDHGAVSHPGTIPVADIAKIQGQEGPAVKVRSGEEAVHELLQGHKVELPSEGEVSIMLDKLRAVVKDAESKGDKAPAINLCNVTVKGSSLFCVNSKGVPRIKMPQLSGIPTPGSRADKLPKNKKGEVDLGEMFRAHMEAMGHTVTDETMPAEHLMASQNELNGTKVAGMAKAMEEGKIPNARIFVSKDNYVVDGHHRWAAKIGSDLADGVNDHVEMDVAKIDMSILDLLAEANKFSIDMGIPQASMAAEVPKDLPKG